LAAPASAYVYWANSSSNTIGRANLDGTGVNQSFITAADDPFGVAVDGQHIYWTNYGNGSVHSTTIGRAKLDGSDATQSFITGADQPAAVAVDGQHIYWANAGSNAIGRANLDGTGVNQRFITGAHIPISLAVDGQHIYWGNGNINAIGRANLDGTGVNETFITGADGLAGLAVDSRHIYWGNAGTGTIGRASLDGTGVNQSFITTSGTEVPNGVAVDSQHIYWSDSYGSTITHANLDGTGVNETFITGAGHPFGVAVDSGVILTGGPALTTSRVNPEEAPMQVVFVHGIRAGCDEPGRGDYSALYDTLAGSGRGVYTFCYDHDLAFSRNPSWRAHNRERCFSDTSRGEPEAVKKLSVPFDGAVGPLYASESLDQAEASNTYDGNGPLAYDATKLDDCLKALIAYDIKTRGHPEAIAVIGNSMGGAITRGWLALAKARSSSSLDAVTSVIFLEGATQGAWIAVAAGTLHNASSEGPDGFVVGPLSDFASRFVFSDLLHAYLFGPGVRDLAPRSAWYDAIATRPVPHLHYFTFSVDITLEAQIKELWWSQTVSTDFLGDGVIRLGDTAASSEPLLGGSQFLPFGTGPDQHQYVIPRTYNVGDIAIDPITGLAFLGTAAGIGGALGSGIRDVYITDTYGHFHFGANIGSDYVQSCNLTLGGQRITDEIHYLLSNPAEACSASH
jgi:sugar lactone lactonase YvrE